MKKAVFFRFPVARHFLAFSLPLALSLLPAARLRADRAAPTGEPVPAALSAVESEGDTAAEESVTVTRGNLTPTLAAQTTVILAPDFMLSAPEQGSFSPQAKPGQTLRAGTLLARLGKRELRTPVDAALLALLPSAETLPKNYPLARLHYAGFALQLEARSFLKSLPADAVLHAKFQIRDGVGPCEAAAVVRPALRSFPDSPPAEKQDGEPSSSPAAEAAPGDSLPVPAPPEGESAQLLCLIPKEIDVAPGQIATLVISSSIREKVLRLPVSAVAGRFGKGQVSLIKGGKKQLTDITLGITDGAYVEILSGLREGDQVTALPPNLDPRRN